MPPRRRYEPALTRKALEASAAKTKLHKPIRARQLAPRVRVLPLTIVMAFLLLGVKVSDLYHNGKTIRLQLQEARASTALAAESEEAKAEEGGVVAPKDDTPKPPPQQSAEDAQAAEALKIAKLKEENDKITGQNRQFSQIEIDLLQKLRERREEIEARDRALDLKEKLLDATELRINDKISEIKGLEQKVAALLKKYNEQEESHIRSLVKIYESMKPKSAAAIFNELELPILLEVVDRMSERKVAPILAAMDPLKAKEVTADLAEMRKLNAKTMQGDVN